jgi:hypothetical protein
VLGVEEGSVGAGADLVDDVGLQIGVDGARHVLALAYEVLAVCGPRRDSVQTYRSQRRRC